MQLKTFTKSFGYRTLMAGIGALASLLCAGSFAQAETYTQDNQSSDSGWSQSRVNIGNGYHLNEPNSQSQSIVVNGNNLSSMNFSQSKAKDLGRKLREKFKLTLFTSTTRRQQHRFFINTLKKELVGKARIGRLKYELKIREDEAEAYFSFNLN